MVGHYEEERYFEWLEKGGYPELGRVNVDRAVFSQAHNWEQATGCTSAQLTPAFARFILANQHLQKTIPGAREALIEINRYGYLHLLTARGKVLQQTTQNFLTRHCLGVPFLSYNWDSYGKKADPILEHSIRIHIEDCAQETKAILEQIGDRSDILIIQFPSFRGPTQETIADDRVYRLEACDQVRCLYLREQLWQLAWKEIRAIVPDLLAPALA
ncbi:MAG: hypothetical protein WEC84_04650 [Candidatus Andersenbacteria bacterium]